ncbi:MAG TPA: sugar transferase [Anaerolineaceae bacterium]|nr:sugar transferase [Anaerolineaceae bacterium]
MHSNSVTSNLRLTRSEQRFLLVMGDILAGFLALFVAVYVWSRVDQSSIFNLAFIRTRVPSWFYLLPLLWILFLVEVYDLRKASSYRETFKGIGMATLLAGLAYLIVYFASTPVSLPRVGVAAFVIAVALITLIWRVLFIQMFSVVSRQKRVLIVGAGRAGTVLTEEFSKQTPPPFNLIGLIDDDPTKLGHQISGYPIIGNHESLNEVIADQNITDLILAISNKMNHGMFQTLLAAQESGMGLSTMEEAYESLTNRVPISLLESDWVIREFLDHSPNSGFYRIFKRLIDIVLAIIGLIFLVLFFPLIALVIYLDSGLPIIFRQERIGKSGYAYTMLKFRTMKNSRDMEKEALVTQMNDPRITQVGKFLRKSHLDELPQVLNVLKGEMSVVGPRSERSELVVEFQKRVPFYRARFLVKPGLTGWAQIHQAYAETVDETSIKLEYDLYYIQHCNMAMDFLIMLRTLGAVFGFKGR